MYNQNKAFPAIYYSYLLSSVKLLFANFFYISTCTFYTNIEYIMRTYMGNNISFVIFHLFITLKVILDKLGPWVIGLDYP